MYGKGELHVLKEIAMLLNSLVTHGSQNNKIKNVKRKKTINIFNMQKKYFTN